MSDHAPLMPHGALREVFSNIFFVTGTSRPNFNGTQFQFSRNMTVVREGDALTLINTVRLDDSGLEALDALGKVQSIVRLGAFHGIDDRYYVDRYGARQWALEGHQHDGGQSTDNLLVAGGEVPCSGASVFVFETSKMPEALILLDREGGILVSCDSLQNWAETDDYFDEATAQMMTGAGFIKPANIGPGWRKAAEPQASDFEKVLALEFQHLLPAHGTPLKGDAKAQLGATFKREFGA